MIKNNLVICNKLGLHARAASKLVSLSLKFNSEITLTVNKSNITANCKSIMGIMMLEASYGTKITITTTGCDETESNKAVTTLISNKFGEEQ